jgi:hypothetical protein
LQKKGKERQKEMEKKVLTAILTVFIIATTAVTATAITASRTIQATLSPDVTIVFDGKAWEMYDVNENQVYPILYNGTTYVPIRAVSEMLGLVVMWDNDSRTVQITSSVSNAQKSLLSATDAGTRTTSGNVSRWMKVRNVEELPGAYSDGLKTDFLSATRLQTRTMFTLDGRYNTLEFTAHNTSNYSAIVRVIDASDGTVLWSATLTAGEKVKAHTVNLSGVREIEFSANKIDLSASAGHSYNAIYICDPIVK